MGDSITVGDAIRVLRTKMGISARTLSVSAGLSPAYISKVESGSIEPSFRAFSKIADVLNMTQGEIWILVRSESKR